MKPPRYAKRLQEEALAMLEPKKRTEKEFVRESLLNACSKAAALAVQLERLQPKASARPLYLLSLLASALVKIAEADGHERNGYIDEKMHKRAENLRVKALTAWYEYAKELPETLAFDLERVKRQQEIEKLPAGFTSAPLPAVAKPKAAAKRGVPLKKKKA